jgi:hypothetical protein
VKRWERWSFNIASTVVTATGIAYFWMKYFVVSDDPFAVVNHPLQGAMLDLHLMTAPVFILIAGMVLRSHVLSKLTALRMPSRRSGLTSFVAFAFMIASGYLLQIVTHERALTAMVVIHVGAGMVFAVSYTAHLIVSLRRPHRAAVTVPDVV